MLYLPHFWEIEVHLRRLRYLALPFLFALVAPLPLAAFQLDTGRNNERSFSITGNVYFEDISHPASNVAIQLQGGEGAELSDGVSSDGGYFEFRRLRPGSYTLSIDLAGYERVSLSVDASMQFARGLQIVLHATQDSKAPGGANSVSAHELSMPAKARDMMASGRTKLYQTKDANAALADFRQAVEIAPQFYEAEYQVAMAQLTLGQRDDASASFQKSIDISEGKYGEAYVGLATLLLDRGDLSGGEKAVRRGLELSPDFWLGSYELGRAELYQGHIADAEKSAEQARSLAPTAPVVYRLLANIHIQKKDYRAAQADIDAYIKLDPDSPAGVRAKQLRDELSKKIGPESASQPAIDPHN